MQTWKFSVTSGVGTLSLSFSRAQLLPLALSLECLGENKVSRLLHLTNTRCLAQGPIYLLPQSLQHLLLSAQNWARCFLFFNLFLAVLGLHCCLWAFSSCGERGLLFLRRMGFSLWWLFVLRSTGSRLTGFSSCGSQVLECRLSSCGTWA